VSGSFEDGTAAGVAAERARTLAYLGERHRAQAAVARQYGRAELDALAEDRRRQLEIMIEEIEAEMHCHSAPTQGAD
jgi:hypothetical protein